MLRLLTLAALIIAFTTGPVQAARMHGQYVEVRNCDVWTGPCFANAESNLSGKNAALVWSINQGSFDDVKLDGLSVVAVIEASDTLGFKQTGPCKSVLIVDSRANDVQKAALVKLS